MKPPRRTFLHLAASAAVLSAVSRIARADTYPSRPVRIIVGLPAGAAPDIIARLTGQWLSERLGQQFVIINRPGGATTIGTEAVVRAPPDGFTLLLMFVGTVISAKLYENLNFDLIRDIVPVASIGGSPFVLVVNPSVPAKTLPEFIAYAKANPGKLNMVSSGSGTAPHVFGELFKMMTGVDLVHVPYRASYMPDLLGGHVQVLFIPIAQAIEYIRAGKLRVLGVTTATRLEALPDVPPISDFVPGYEASGWYGVGAPKGTPSEVIEKLNMGINAVVADPAMKARLIGLGAEPTPMTPTEFGKFIAAENEKWAKVIKFANIKPE